MLQKQSRWITRFLLIWLLLTLIGVAHAREDNLLVIHFTIADSTELPLSANSVLSAAADNVAEAGITVQYEYVDEFAVYERPPFIWFSSETVAFFSVEQPALSLVDPMLQTGDEMAIPLYFNQATCVQIGRANCDAERDFIINEVTAYLLYIAREYDLSETLLSNLQDSQAYPNRTHTHDHFILGNINILQSDYERAIEHYQAVESGDSYLLTAATINRAWVELQLGNTDNAFELIDNLLVRAEEEEISQNYVDALVARARLYALTFDYDSAITDMDSAIALADENEFADTALAELYTIRGEVIFLIYEWDRVEENFNTAIALAPTYAPAYFQRGILFYTVAQREAAQADFEMYLELAPDGIYAEQAQTYIESIEIELDALGN